MLAQVPGVTRAMLTDQREDVAGYEVESERGRDVRRELARTVVTKGWGLLELRPMRMSLEEIFLQLTTEEVPEDNGAAQPGSRTNAGEKRRSRVGNILADRGQGAAVATSPRRSPRS